jgi:hypothetical protein
MEASARLRAIYLLVEFGTKRLEDWVMLVELGNVQPETGWKHASVQRPSETEIIPCSRAIGKSTHMSTHVKSARKMQAERVGFQKDNLVSM